VVELTVRKMSDIVIFQSIYPWHRLQILLLQAIAAVNSTMTRESYHKMGGGTSLKIPVVMKSG